MSTNRASMPPPYDEGDESDGMPAPAPPPNYDAIGPSAPGYAPRGRASSNQALHIYSVGRRPERVQAAGLRRPFDFDPRHGIFLRLRFEMMPIPAHAMGVAYLNYREAKWMFARRFDNYHVVFRASTNPYVLHEYPQRLSQFATEAISRVGTFHINGSRWFYFGWDTAHYGAGGELLL